MDRRRVRFGLAVALVLVALCVGMSLIPDAAYATTDFKTPGGIHMTSPQNVTFDYHEDEKVLAIYAKGDQSITLSGTSKDEAVYLGTQGAQYGHVDVTFKNLTIDARSNSNEAAFRWGAGGQGSSVTLTLEGKNALYSSWGYAGLQKDENSGLNSANTHKWDPTAGDFYATQGPEKDTGNPWLHITGDGELTAEGGGGGAGIGGGELGVNVNATAAAGYIAIGDADGKHNPTVIAKGGTGAAGIGGGRGTADRDNGPFVTDDSNWGPLAQGIYILIRSGNVTATGGAETAASGAGIGGGLGGRGENIWISGGVVKATGSGSERTGAPAIGAGYEGAAHNIFITGGEVHAVAPSIGGEDFGMSRPCYPFGDGSWMALHFVDKPVMKITGGAIDLSGSWTSSSLDGQQLIISSKKKVSAIVTGGIFGSAHASQGAAGTGKIYGQDIASGHIVLHNTDPQTSERFPWKVEQGTRELAVSGGVEDKDYTYKNGVLTTLTSTPMTIRNRAGVAEAVGDRIVLAGTPSFVSLDGVVITRPSGASGEAAAPLLASAKPGGTLVLGGVNVLKAGGDAAGVQVGENASIEIASSPQAMGSLDARGSGGGAGIGGANGGRAGGIVVSGGAIKARGSNGAAAIGSGKGGAEPVKPVALKGGLYADGDGVEGAAGTGQVYGVAPYAGGGLTYAVMRNADPATSSDYPFAIVLVQKAGRSLSIYGEGLREGTDWTYTDNVLTVRTSRPVTIALAPNYERSGTRVVVATTQDDQPAQITLLKLALDMMAADSDGAQPNGGSAIQLQAPARLTLVGSNSIQAGTDGAAIENAGHALTIAGEGSLKARASGNAAAIGGTAQSPNASNITIESGDITATAEGRCVAAIGAAATMNAMGLPEMGASQNIAIIGGAIKLVNERGVAGRPLLGGAPEAPGNVPVALSGGVFADADAVPGGAGVGSVYGAPLGSGYRLIKTDDAELAKTHPYMVIADTRELAVYAADGPAREYEDFTYLDGVLKITSVTPMTIRMATPDAQAAQDRIVIDLLDASQTAHVAFDAVRIDRSVDMLSGKAPVDIARGGLDMELVGTTQLDGGRNPAVKCGSGRLKIFGEGTLEAHTTPVNTGSVITTTPVIGSNDSSAVDIEIAGGTVRATQDNPQDSHATSIGCTWKGSVKSIDITGGRVEVSVPGHANAIGSEDSTNGVHVSGGMFGAGDAEGNTVYGVVPAQGYRVVDTGDAEFPFAVEPAPCDLVVQGDDIVLGRDWQHDPATRKVTISTDKPVTVSMPETLTYPSGHDGAQDHTSEFLIIDPGADKTARVTFDGVCIDGRATGTAALEIASGGLDLTLARASYSSLFGADELPALLSGKHVLRITSDEAEPGTLHAQGGMLAAGIGGARGEAAGDIEISGGTVLAQGGYRSAGIGGGFKTAEASNVAVSGGSLDVRAGNAETGGSIIGNGEGSSGASAISLTGGRYADADACYVEDSAARGSVYGIAPADGHAVFPLEDPAYPAGVFPLAETEIEQDEDRVVYDGGGVRLADLATTAGDAALSSVTAIWFDASGKELEGAPVGVGSYRVHLTRGAQVIDGIGYLPFEGDFEFSIVQRELAIDGAVAESRQYDGTTQAEVKLLLKGAAPGDIPTVTFDTVQWKDKNAGTTEFVVEGIALEGAGVNPVNRNYTLAGSTYAGRVDDGRGITPRELDLGWIDPGRVVDDGKRITVEERDGVTRKLMETDGVGLTVAGGDANTVGEHVATASLSGPSGACANYEIKADQAEYRYRVAASAAALSAAFDHADGVYTYGEDIRVTGLVAAAGTAVASDDPDAAATPAGEVALYAGDAELARGPVAVDGAFALTISTLDRRLATGVHDDLRLEFEGSVEIAAASLDMRRVGLRKAALTATVSGSATKLYDGTAELPADAARDLALSVSGAVGNDAPSVQATYAFAGKDAGSIPILAEAQVVGELGDWYEIGSIRVDAVGSIAPRLVELAWSGTEQVVGDDVSVSAALANAVEGDDVLVLVANATSNVVGEHVARATGLSGADAGNYVLPGDSSVEITYRVSAAPDTGEGGEQGGGDTGQGGPSGDSEANPPAPGGGDGGPHSSTSGGTYDGSAPSDSLPSTGDRSVMVAVLVFGGFFAVLAGAALKRVR